MIRLNILKVYINYSCERILKNKKIIMHIDNVDLNMHFFDTPSTLYVMKEIRIK